MGEELLIKAENENPSQAKCHILDNHSKHIASHKDFIGVPGMHEHIKEHVDMLVKHTDLELPAIAIEEILGIYKSRL